MSRGRARDMVKNPARASRFWVAWSVATACTTLWFYGLDEARYARVTENLLPGEAPWLGAPADRVQVGALQRLTAAETAAPAHVLQPIRLPAHRDYEIRAVLHLEGVQLTPGAGEAMPSQWGGRLVMIPRHADGRPLYGEAHVVATRSGTEAWCPTSGIITMPPDVESAFVGVDLHASEGELRAHSFEVFAVRERASAIVGYWLLVCCWVAVCCRGWRLLFPRFRLDRAHVAAVSVLVAMLVGMLVPKAIPQAVLRVVKTGSFSPSEVNPASLVLAPAPLVEIAVPVAPTPTPLRVEKETKISHKTAHLLLFWMLTLALRWTGSCSIRRLLLIGAVLAVGTEMAQWFAPTRSSAWFDVGVDLLGVGLALLTIQLGRGLRRRPRRASFPN